MEASATGEGAEVDCSILVPVLNEAEHLRDTVPAMLAQRFPGTLEVLLVDGGSTDGTAAVLERLASEDARIRVLANPRRGTPSGLNVALAAARGRWVARMDAHTTYPPDYIALGVQRLQRGDTSWVSGTAIASGQGRISRAIALALRTPLGRGGSRKWAASASESGEIELDSGVFAGVWERTTLLEYGGWDERWLRNQDSEMAGRFLARGEKLICLQGMGSHYVPRDTLAGLWRQYAGYGTYRLLTARRHPHTMRRSHLLAPGIVVAGVAALIAPTPARRLARVGVAAYAAALAGSGAVAVRMSGEPRDGLLVPAVLATMQLSYGTGALRAAARHGLPLAALARIFGARRLAARWAPAEEPVYAPSLSDGLAVAPASKPVSVAPD